MVGEKPLQKTNTFKELQSKYYNTDEAIASMYFRLAQEYRYEKWRFRSDDFASAKKTDDLMGRPAIAFEIREDRKKDFINFTRSHIARRLAIVVNGYIWCDPTIQGELPGSGIISGPQPNGFSKEEQIKLLTSLKYASGARVLKYEFVETRICDEE